MKQSVRSLGLAALLAVIPQLASASPIPSTTSSSLSRLEKSTVLYAASPAAAAAAAESTDDAALAAKVKARLAEDPQLKALDLTITAKRGAVTIKGVVVEPAARQKIVDTVKSIDGVKKVDGKMTTVAKK